MLAMLLDAPGQALRPARVPLPVAGPEDVLIKVNACGVCRTDLHIADGELAPRGLPRVLGHEIVGTVVRLGSRVRNLVAGQRVGVPWLGGSCRHCPYCTSARENLCDRAVFTGYHRDGGYAEFAVADARYCLSLPGTRDDAHAAPLLCAGLIVYRAYALTGSARRIGLYGFGAAAHIIAQLAHTEGRHVYAFTRPGDARSQRFALELGACWAGPSDAPAPQALDAAIIFAPDGALLPLALAACRT
jgi:propanol-preferring alcohol dehydrogenase